MADPRLLWFSATNHDEQCLLLLFYFVCRLMSDPEYDDFAPVHPPTLKREIDYS